MTSCYGNQASILHIGGILAVEEVVAQLDYIRLQGEEEGGGGRGKEGEEGEKERDGGRGREGGREGGREEGAGSRREGGRRVKIIKKCRKNREHTT